MIDYVAVMEGWVRANRKHEPLYPELEIQTSPPEWAGQSVLVKFVHPNALGGVTVWDTGQCEVEFASFENDDQDLIRTTHVGSSEELTAVLDEVLRCFQ